MTEAPESQRIDKWLWCARFFRTREAAATFIETQSARLMRAGRPQRITKRGFALKAGDELSFLLSDRLMIIRVRAFAPRRGTAQDAARLFDPLGMPKGGASRLPAVRRPAKRSRFFREPSP